MCGICGIYSFSRPVNTDDIRKMNHVIRHRGPDDEGFLMADTNSGVFRTYSGNDTIDILRADMPAIESAGAERWNMAWGHRRLSIIDLTEKGHQPMFRNRNWIVYNGEIYNYIELRNELKAFGHYFDTKSDTEVILAAYQQWGIDCLSRFNGMWAFALWDHDNRRLVCARDRFGIKPFYYARQNGCFLFASEIKAILASGLVRADANERTVSHFLLFGTVDHAHQTFFNGINRLNPGDAIVASQNGDFKTIRWWRLEKKECRNDDLLEEFKSTFNDSVKLRLRSDVPVGTCLSGGLDSSYVAATMTAQCREVNSFSAVYGSGVPGDETEYIDELTRYTGARKHWVVPSGEGLQDHLEKLVYHQEEPFGSTSIFAQWKVMELARDSGVIVLLDGQGADELLSGYHPYIGLYYSILLKRFRLIKWFRELVHCIRLHGIGKIVAYTGYYMLPVQMQLKTRSRACLLRKPLVKKHAPSYPTETFTDFNEYLRYALEKSLPQLLRYEDKNSMAFSRETRLPFLDFRLVQLVYSMPVEEKIDGAVTKKIMRSAMNGIVPDKIVHRYDKIGFETPQDRWFRDIMSPMIRDIFGSAEFNDRPYWHGKAVREMFDRFMKGKSASNQIWRVLSTELWFRQYIEN